MRLRILPIDLNQSPSSWGQIIDDPGWFGYIFLKNQTQAEEKGIQFLSQLVEKTTQMRKKSLLEQLSSLFLPPYVTSFSGVIPSEGNHVFLFVDRGAVLIMKRGNLIVPILAKKAVMKGELKPTDVLFIFQDLFWQQIGPHLSSLLSDLHTVEEMNEAISLWAQKETNAESVVGGIIFSETEIKKEHVLQKVESHKTIAFTPKLPTLSFPHISKSYLIALLCGLFFVGSVALGVHRQMNDTETKTLTATLQRAKQLTQEALSLEDSKPQKSRELLETAKESLLPYTQKPPKGKVGKEIEEVQLTITQSLQRVMKISSKDVSLYFDATALQEGRSIQVISPGVGIIGLLDPLHGMIAVLSMERKNAEIVGGGSTIQNPRLIAFDETVLYVLSDVGIVRISPTTKEPKLVIEKNKLPEPIDAITTFGGNVYGLQKKEGMVYRFTEKEGVFGEKESYFPEEAHPDLSNTTNMVIDGSVWFGSTIGKVFRYTQGRDDPFLPLGIDPPLGDNLQIDIPPESENIYILDKTNYRVVMVSKSGGYKAQYVAKDAMSIDSFVVSETLKRAFLLSNQKIYMMSLE